MEKNYTDKELELVFEKILKMYKSSYSPKENPKVFLLGGQPGAGKTGLENMINAKDDEIIFSATGITGGDLLEGVKRKGSIARTQTLVVRGLSKTVRYINSIHNLDFKDEKITHLVK